MTVKCNSFWVLDKRTINTKCNDKWVAQGLLEGTLRAVCDGSYKPKLNDRGITDAWIIEDDKSTSNITCTIATSGITSDPYRGELLGIYAILSTIRYIEKYNNNFTVGSIKVGCNNEKTGWISGKSNPAVSSTSKHSDLVRAIRRLNYSLNTSVEFYHIYGHKDNNTPYHLLPRPAQLNVIVDDLAQVQFDNSYKNSKFIPNVLFHHEGWSVKIGGVKLQDKLLLHIRNWVAKRKLCQYLFEKDLVAWNLFPCIDFETLRIYMSAQSRSFQLSMYNNLREIDLHQMWLGFLPVGMIDCQESYYQQIGSRKSAKRWGIDLVQKMLCATHGLWMERNNLLHLRAANGMRGLNNIALQTAVSQQHSLGYKGLEEEDIFLLENSKDELMKEPVEMIRGWLCEIMIERGDLASARLESLRDRGEITHVLPILTEAEKTSYLDWRKVCLKRQS